MIFFLLSTRALTIWICIACLSMANATEMSLESSNITWLLLNKWIPSSQPSIIVDQKLFSVQLQLHHRLEWLVAITSLCDLGYEFHMDSAGNGVFTLQTPLRHQIPRIVHQTWKTANIGTHSKDALECSAQLKLYASDFYRVVWTDMEIMDFIKHSYPKYFPFYLKLNMNIKRADIARYLILHKFGGVYIDLDIEMKAPLSPLMRPSPSSPLAFITYRSKEFQNSHELFAGNAFFACPPRSKVLEAVLKLTTSYPQQKVTAVVDVLRHTGPLALGKALEMVRVSNSAFLNQKNNRSSVSSETSGEFRVYNCSIIGNVEDRPSSAVHRRKHRWGPK